MFCCFLEFIGLTGRHYNQKFNRLNNRRLTNKIYSTCDTKYISLNNKKFRDTLLINPKTCDTHFNDKKF